MYKYNTRYHLISKKCNKYLTMPGFYSGNNSKVSLKVWDNAMDKMWMIIKNGSNHQFCSCCPNSSDYSFILHRQGSLGYPDIYNNVDGIESNSICEIVSVDADKNTYKIKLISLSLFLTSDSSGNLSWSTQSNNDTDSQIWILSEVVNTATIKYANNTYSLYINDSGPIYSDSNSTRMNTIKNRFNTLFADTDRDLDFITPSFDDVYRQYVVCCPRVRMNQGEKTYFYDGTNNAKNNYYPEKLYENTVFDTTLESAKITGLLTILENDRPWYWALYYANLIRKAVYLNFAPPVSEICCKEFVMPNNTKSSSKKFMSAPYLSSYGNICQGSAPGLTSPCNCGNGYPNIVENILGGGTSNGEAFHPLGLTAAVSATNFNTYKNKFVKVTSISDPTRSVVLRITDGGGNVSENYIEVCDRVYRALGMPGVGTGKVSVDIMDS